MEVLLREEARFTIVATLHGVQRQAVEVDAVWRGMVSSSRVKTIRRWPL